MRNQAGITLIELLLVVALTGIIIGPLAAWTITTVRQQGMTAAHLSNTVATGRVASIFNADIASARQIGDGSDPPAAAPGSDCSGGPAAGGTVRLSLERSGASPVRIVYVEARPDGAPASSTERSLWRRECTTGGLLATATELFPEIRPGSVIARCPVPSTAVSDCSDAAARRVQLSVTPDGPTASPRPVVLQATRRADAGSIGMPGSGNRPPIAQIDVGAVVGFLNEPIRFSGARSEDLDGPLTSASYEWEFPSSGGGAPSATGVTVDHIFTQVGEHTVLLTVTDADGATNVAAVTVRIDNRHPTAVAQVSPETGAVAAQTFTFDATASADGDGDALTYRWVLGPDRSGNPIVDTRARFDLVFPTGTPTGPRQISLTVEDGRGGSDTRVLQMVVGSSGSTAGIVINPEPVLTGGVAVVGTVGAGRPGLFVQFSTSAPGGAGETWQLNTAAGQVVATGSAATMTHTFTEGQHGEYRISRRDGAGQLVGTERAFRVNAAPVAGFTFAAAGDAPASVAFSTAGGGGSSDADGSIVSWRWDFGHHGSWTSSSAAPTQTFTHPGSYLVRLIVVDSDGASSTIQQSVVVTGPLVAPPAPTWTGGVAHWAAVPGAEAYRVVLTCAGVAEPPIEVDAEANPELAPSPTWCPAPAAGSASYSLRAAGVWGPTSPPGARP